jgi:hypothetical protein
MWNRDRNGEVVRGNDLASSVTTQFAQWCSKRGDSLEMCAKLMMSDYPAAIATLNILRDPRSIALLREGLRSDSFTIVYGCAQALTTIRPQTLVEDVAMAAERMPLPIGKGLMAALAYLDGSTVDASVRAAVKSDALYRYFRQTRDLRSRPKDSRQ